jgi:hypothetical protein
MSLFQRKISALDLLWNTGPTPSPHQPKAENGKCEPKEKRISGKLRNGVQKLLLFLLQEPSRTKPRERYFSLFCEAGPK